MDPNIRPLLVDPGVYRAAMPRWAALADIAKVSEEDLAHLASLDGFCAGLHAAGVRLVPVTRGADGVRPPHWTASGWTSRPPWWRWPTRWAPVTPSPRACCTGLTRWDAWAGGSPRSGRPSCDDALAFAVRVAALTCTVAGANPPWAAALTSAVTTGANGEP
ncbi:hypothetical protein [Nonomuraea dietziae]|uniref:Sugar/nucleoside kinase (Ribokinase family) n=1 Tax=Nonomuraea dietziae TaxID=65515 RepID=A0A7W5VAR5_9ACTN|nr:hypothetical protein [Nonomuraea dietziae]MBB3728065.1 sugar/nucleoside kinase (ribokinase family) [Nonomuraea dietziae]